MRLIAASVLTVVALVTAGCGAPRADVLSLSGRVEDDLLVIAAPGLSAPARPDAKPATVTALMRMGLAARLATVAVEPGDRIQAGDLLALFDGSELDARVSAARASHRVAISRVAVLGARLDDVASGRRTIAENRSDVTRAVSDLQAARRQLLGRLAEAQGQLDQLKQVQEQLRRLPPMPPGAPRPPGLPDPARVAANVARLESGIAQMRAGIARIDNGLARARSGVTRLNAADAKAADAEVALEAVRDVARTLVGVAALGVDLEETRRDLAALYSPSDGLVVSAAHPGEVVAASAPVVTIRPKGFSQVTVFVTPVQRASISVGDPAMVRIDSRPGETFSARVTQVGIRAQYPPSWVTTGETHMTRAFAIRVTLDSDGEQLPPGTPADVSFGDASGRAAASTDR